MDSRRFDGQSWGGSFGAGTGVRRWGDGDHRLEETPTTELVREFFAEGQKVMDETRVLLRAEFDEAREEIRAEVKKATRIGVWYGAGGLLLHTGFIILMFAAVFALWAVLPLWASGLIVGAVLAIGGGICAAVGKKQADDLNLKPEKAVGHLKEDARWAKDTMRRNQSSVQARA